MTAWVYGSDPDKDRYCSDCGALMVESYRNTGRYDTTTGRQWVQMWRTCPNRPRMFAFLASHDRFLIRSFPMVQPGD